MNNLNELSKFIYEGNKLRGFDVSKENIGQSLMLVVSELAEALEADRKGIHADLSRMNFVLGENAEHSSSEHFKSKFGMHIKDTFEDEIADALIRLFDLCGGLDIDIETHIELKLKYNATRQFKHGKRY